MRLRTLVPLAPLTTFRVGGPAKYFGVVRTLNDLREGVSFAHRERLPVFILGDGSNIIIPDKGFDGLVLKIELMGVNRRSVSGDDVEIVAGAGEAWDAFVSTTVSEGLWGLENLSGIPGTVGAAPIQNIGAYGVEVKDTLAWVEVFDMSANTLRIMSLAECMFGYRTSIFKHAAERSLVIVRVAFRLSTLPRPTLSYKDLAGRFASHNASALTATDVRAAVLSIRAERFPPLTERVGTAGSFFKNPVVEEPVLRALRAAHPDLPAFPGEMGGFKVPLAWILDHILHLKGYRSGRVALFERQPLVLIAFRGATASDIDAFADDVAARVRNATGIAIEREVVSVA